MINQGSKENIIGFNLSEFQQTDGTSSDKDKDKDKDKDNRNNPD